MLACRLRMVAGTMLFTGWLTVSLTACALTA